MPEIAPPVAAVTLFYSYAHEDEPLRDELAGHLKILERRGLIQAWHDRKIVAGQDWAQAIDENLDSAELVLLLISKDFVESDYCFGVELKRTMERQAAKACEVVPIFVRAVSLEAEDAEDFPFMKLQGLPTDLKAVTSWANRDEAWTNVAKGLRATVSGIRARRPAPVASTAPTAKPPETFGAAAVAPVRASASPDIVLDGLISGVMQQIDQAETQRGGGPLFDHFRYELQQGTRALIDVPDQKRILWVDDRPENNRQEMAVLAKLQIEVVAVRSTDEALRRMADDAKAGETFDLVLTDWDRPAEGPNAALTLLKRLRGEKHAVPVVLYHGEFDPERRAKRAAKGTAAGAMGEAVMPSELMRLVEKVLSGA